MSLLIARFDHLRPSPSTPLFCLLPLPSGLVRPRLARRTATCAILSPNIVSGKDIAGRRDATTCVLCFFLSCFSRVSMVDRGPFWFEHAMRPPSMSRILGVCCSSLYTDRRFETGVGFPTSLASTSNTSPTIVHLSIRPYALPSDDPAFSKKKRLSVAISRRLSSAGVGMGGGTRDVDHEADDESSRAGCCTGCTIC